MDAGGRSAERAMAAAWRRGKGVVVMHRDL
jgi:hypothetical protein